MIRSRAYWHILGTGTSKKISLKARSAGVDKFYPCGWILRLQLNDTPEDTVVTYYYVKNSKKPKNFN